MVVCVRSSRLALLLTLHVKPMYPIQAYHGWNTLQRQRKRRKQILTILQSIGSTGQQNIVSFQRESKRELAGDRARKCESDLYFSLFSMLDVLIVLTKIVK